MTYEDFCQKILQAVLEETAKLLRKAKDGDSKFASVGLKAWHKNEVCTAVFSSTEVDLSPSEIDLKNMTLRDLYDLVESREK